MSKRTYRIRSSRRQDGKPEAYSIALPKAIGELLYRQRTEFVFELTDEGMVYRPVDLASDVELPDWAKDA